MTYERLANGNEGLRPFYAPPISGWGGIRADSHNPLQLSELGNPDQASAAAGAATEGESTPIDPGLALIVNQWPSLPEAVRQQVVELVKTATACCPAKSKRS
jgi:hypothetical protein